MLLCFSAVASAQAIYSVSSTPVTTVISTGNAELSGSITFTASRAAVAGTITIYYGGANITTPFSSITITGDGVTVNTTASAYSPGSLVLSIAAGAGTFTVSNVRVQVSGTGLSKLDATISATGNQIAAGSTTVTLINSTTGVGIASVASYKDAAPITLSTASTLGLPSINAVSGAFDVSSNTNTTIVVKEGFLAAFTSQVGVRVTVSATPPKGVTFTFPATANSYSYDAAGTAPTLMHGWIRGTSTVATGAGTEQKISYTSTTSSSLQVNYYVATDASSGTADTAIEYLEIPVTAASDATIETFPLAAKQFTYTVSLAPVLGAYTSSGTPYSSPAPRFTASESSAANLAAITGRTSALLIPFASTLSGFDTALSISNTTYDPGATLLGVATAAAPQSGTVTFYFFPQKTAAYTYSSYTTAAGSPGTGLDSSGNIISGGTYTVFVSQLAPLATPALTSFSGYIIAVTNFTNAQGIFVISNFTNLSVQSGMMGVIGDRSALPERIF